MSHTEPDWGFRFMALGYRFRDMRQPRRLFLEEAGVTHGLTVLDYGCGPGGYAVPAAEMVGREGKVYALDVNPTALRMTTEKAGKAKLLNITAILSDCETGLAADSVDVALLYDIYHDLSDPLAVLTELHRILKPGGLLSSHDHHLKGDLLREAIESSGLFRLTDKGALTSSFTPEKTEK
ncbi:MAG: class I SAM-dependent methyltransferase [Dehalococcoidia bacterium]|nr:class I SAM-dependent methyltransferase [Dehalococcoidia bacterium]